MSRAAPLTVTVIGAGIIGPCAAMEIQRGGHHVLRTEPDSGQVAAYGNAGWLAKLVAASIDGWAPPFDPVPCSARRFA